MKFLVIVFAVMSLLSCGEVKHPVSGGSNNKLEVSGPADINMNASVVTKMEHCDALRYSQNKYADCVMKTLSVMEKVAEMGCQSDLSF